MRLGESPVLVQGPLSGHLQRKASSLKACIRMQLYRTDVLILYQNGCEGHRV